MAFANPQELVDAAKKGRGYYNFRDIAGATAYLERRLQEALKNQLGKGEDRPWHIVDFAKKLDPKEAWIGFEFETGFDDKKEYEKVINFLWGLDHIALDKEGTGKYPVEIAFPPQELSKILAQGSLVEQLLSFIEKNNITPALNPTTYTRRDVGIHAGISTAKFRAGGDGYAVSRRLNNILLSLKKKEMDDVYGRSALHWGGCNNRGSYIEVKTFKAIPDIDRVRRYVKTVEQMTKLLDFLIDNPKVEEIKNAYQFLRGDTNEIEV